MSEEKRPQRVSKDLWTKLKVIAQEKRKNPTPAENHLWQLIRNRKVINLKFRRQYVIENFIVDFYCAELKLVIEIDGEIHNFQQKHDALRQERLEANGVTVIRFTNEQVFEDADTVIKTIEATAGSIRSENSPSPKIGEGVGG